MEAFNFASVRNFIFEKPKKRYPELVRMFHANLNYKYNIINSEVKKHPIIISLEYFAQIRNL